KVPCDETVAVLARNRDRVASHQSERDKNIFTGRLLKMTSLSKHATTARDNTTPKHTKKASTDFKRRALPPGPFPEACTTDTPSRQRVGHRRCRTLVPDRAAHRP